MSTTRAPAAPASADRTSAPAAHSATPTVAGVSQQLGNQQLQMLLRARLLQAKLTVSHPQDAFELEADRVADLVMRMPEPGVAPPISGVQSAEVSRSSADADVPALDATTEQAIQSLSGRGSALADSTRAFMEPRFNADFSGVRVHNDAPAHELARAVNAQAFTIGNNVVFGAGHYAPHTEGGKRLLAHELTHVVQQSGGDSTSALRRKPTKTPAKAPPEKDKKPDDEYTPMYLDANMSANEWAKFGIELANDLNKQNKTKITYKLVVVTDGLYVINMAGKIEGRFVLTATPPIAGLFLGGGAGDYRAVLDKKGNPRFERVGGWDPKHKTAFIHWTAFTASDERRYFPGDTVPLIIIPGRPAASPSPSKTPENRPEVPLDPDAVAAPAAKSSKGKADSPEGLKRPLSGDEYESNEKGKAANYPAFPAEIKASSGLVALNGANELTMRLQWQHGEKEFVKAVWNASTPVHYRWERWDVSNVPEFAAPTREAAMRARRQNPRDPYAKVDDQFVEHDERQRLADIREDIENSRRTIKEGGHTGLTPKEREHEVKVEKNNLAMAPISIVKSSGAHLLDTVHHWASKPENEITLEWLREGKFFIRCIAQPHEHDGHKYLPSVATAFVEVRSAEYLAVNTMAMADAQLDELKVLYESATTPGRKQMLKEQIDDLKLSTRGSAVEVLRAAVTKKQTDLARARGKDKTRREEELKALRLQLEIAERNESGMAVGPDGKKLEHALRPRAAIASEVTGATFPLMLQLVPLGRVPRPRWAIYDVTAKGQYLGYPYIGEGNTDGEAIEIAFMRFAGANEYGRGTVILHIPELVKDVSKRHIVLRNVRVGDALAKDRLHDLVAVLMALSFVLPGAGVAAGLIGGALAAERLIARWRQGTLEWSDETIMDLVGVVGAIGIVAGQIASMMVVEAEGAFVIASESADVAAIKNAMKGVNRANFAAKSVHIANQVVNYGGFILGERQLAKDIENINRAEEEGTMTHAQARSARAKAVLGGIQNRLLLVTGPIHAGRGGPEGFRPTTPDEAAALADSMPAEHEVVGAKPGERTMSGTASGPPRPPGSPPPNRAAFEAAEQLLTRLERGVERTPQPTVAPSRRGTPAPAGEFRRGLTTADAAYQAYTEALAAAHGREVGIYVDPATGEFRVMIGTETGVSAPEEHWIALLHFHPNENNALTFRLPAPVDFRDLFHRFFGENRLVREFVEYDIPGVGRGSTEYGIDPAFPNEPLYIRIHRPDGTVDPPQRFASHRDYGKFWGERAVYVEKGSPQHKAMMRDAAARGRRMRKGSRTSTGTGEPPAREPVPEHIDNEPTERTAAPTMADGDYVIDLQSFGRPTEAAGEIASRRTPPPLTRRAPRVPPRGEPSVQLQREAPAILYELPDGIRLVTVLGRRAYYMSLGKSVSEIDGVRSTKQKGEFYQILGAQETNPPPPPPAIADRVPDSVKNIRAGWLIKAKGYTDLEPNPALHDLNFRLESGEETWTQPKSLNDWLARNGVVPTLDFFRQVLGWGDPPGGGGAPPSHGGGGSPPGGPPSGGPPAGGAPPGGRPPGGPPSAAPPGGGRPPRRTPPGAPEPTFDDEVTEVTGPPEMTSHEPASHDAVPKHIDPHTETTRKLKNPQAASSAARLRQIGDFQFLSAQEWDGTVLRLRIAALTNVRGKQTDVRPFKQFFRQLLEEAEAEGATELRITGELGGNANVARLQFFLRQYNGTVRRIDEGTVEIVIPLPFPKNVR